MERWKKEGMRVLTKRELDGKWEGIEYILLSLRRQ